MATMSIWDPVVEAGTGEFSQSQILLVAGNYEGNDLNTVAAGWQRDSYRNTGCLNLDCAGFVQVPSNYTVGAAFVFSSYGGNQFDIKMSIWKDPEDGNWWLGIGQSFVGYWPSKLFTHLSDGPATFVQWGGEVRDTRSYGQHTTTQMGSGHFAEEGFGKAAFFGDLRIIDHQYHLLPVGDFILQTSNATCYNALKVHNEQWGTHFYYGGPGYNVLCP
ncbi:unnamed protein product [Microthlaspi erraticum]|uniref:Neprosin PEP catalytic domain-containing protein n=1 Tax=Microthlaspi erraticum TaxID=1685480 RepID=A0A6D2JYW1_9BRAS|nr:unnamed protein product [Microthlaspi erraticum]